MRFGRIVGHDRGTSVHDLLILLQELPPLLVYVVAALLVATETALIFGLLLPAEATLLIVGFLAYLGTLRLVPALLVMMAAAALGDSLAFRAGRRYGPRCGPAGSAARVGEERWRKADSMLHRMGGRGVLGARWVAFARTLVPRLAGSAGMSYRRFVAVEPRRRGDLGRRLRADRLPGRHVVREGLPDARPGHRRGPHAACRRRGRSCWSGAGWVATPTRPGRWSAGPANLPPLRWIAQRYGVLFFLLSMQLGAGWALLINLVAGLALLFAGGLLLAWVVRAVVDYSGLSVVDAAIARWMAEQRASDVDSAARAVVSVLNGPVLIGAVAVVAVVLGWRARAWRGDLVSVLGTVGAFLPLVVLALVADRLRPDPAGGDAGWVFLSTEGTIVTASMCTLAWLIARQVGWLWAVTAWTAAAVAVVIVVGARLYLGWSQASEAVTSVLLGTLWTAVFMVAWATRDRAVRQGADPPVADPVPGSGAPNAAV